MKTFKNLKTFLYAAALVLIATAQAADAPANLDELQKLIGLLRANYAGGALDDKTLSTAAIDGVLRKLGASAQILSSADAAKPADASAAIAKQRLFNPSIGYVRVGAIDGGSATGVQEVIREMSEKTLEGLILDLRFAHGRNFGDAAALASLFLSKGKPLIALQAANGETTKKFENDREPIQLTTPLIVLVNSATHGAPEALAAVLQYHKRAILIGNPTAAEAFATSDFPLGDNRVLRLATTRVVVGEGIKLWSEAVRPEIIVKIDAAEEKAILAGTAPKREKKPLHAAGGIRSEAELLSLFENNGQPSPPKPSTEMEEQTDDPVVQRALDVLSAWRTFKPKVAPEAAPTQ